MPEGLIIVHCSHSQSAEHAAPIGSHFTPPALGAEMGPISSLLSLDPGFPQWGGGNGIAGGTAPRARASELWKRPRAQDRQEREGGGAPGSTLSFTPLCWLFCSYRTDVLLSSTLHGRYSSIKPGAVPKQRRSVSDAWCVRAGSSRGHPPSWGATRTRACLDTHCPSRRPLESTWQRLRCKGATFCTVT